MLNPPTPYTDQAIDILAKLDYIVNNPPETGFEFFDQVLLAIDKLNDPHTLFSRPCVSRFYLTLPFRFQFVVSVDSDTSEIDVKTYLTTGYNNLATKTFVGSDTTKQLENKQVLHIALNGESIDTTKEAWETISQWAYDYLGYSRTPAAKLNFAIADSFCTRPLSTRAFPNEEAITIVYLDGEEEKTISLPWYFCSQGNVTDLDDLCPVVESSLSHSNFRLTYSFCL